MPQPFSACYEIHHQLEALPAQNYFLTAVVPEFFIRYRVFRCPRLLAAKQASLKSMTSKASYSSLLQITVKEWFQHYSLKYLTLNRCLKYRILVSSIAQVWRAISSPVFQHPAKGSWWGFFYSIMQSSIRSSLQFDHTLILITSISRFFDVLQAFILS